MKNKYTFRTQVVGCTTFAKHNRFYFLTLFSSKIRSNPIEISDISFKINVDAGISRAELCAKKPRVEDDGLIQRD